MAQMQCIQVGAKALKKLISTFGPEVSICIRGRHAVGKSECTYQAAALLRDDFYKQPNKYNWSYEQGMPVVERRLSQLVEGDLTGMPDLGANRASTVFKPCDWLIDACERPVVLFLDERNRALEGVKQAVFQLMDSRAFYGHKLHPGTRVIVAENVGDQYNVQSCDPAEVSRAATVELNPTVEEWLEYAAPICDDLIVSFIRANKNHLEYKPENSKAAFEPNKKFPDRRSWMKLNHQLVTSKLIENPNDELFYVMVASMVGIEAALEFTKFAKEFEKVITVDDILKDWIAAKRKMGTLNPNEANSKYVELAKKLERRLKNSDLKPSEAEQLALFMRDCPVEPRMETWLAVNARPPNLFKMAPLIQELIVKTARGQDTSNMKTDKNNTKG
jgi:hypothetical protein